jgi:hypothetical protein
VFCSACGEKLRTAAEQREAEDRTLASGGAVMPEDFQAARLAGRMKPHQERSYFDDQDPAADDAAVVARVLGEAEDEEPPAAEPPAVPVKPKRTGRKAADHAKE